MTRVAQHRFRPDLSSCYGPSHVIHIAALNVAAVLFSTAGAEFAAARYTIVGMHLYRVWCAHTHTPISLISVGSSELGSVCGRTVAIGRPEPAPSPAAEQDHIGTTGRQGDPAAVPVCCRRVTG